MTRGNVTNQILLIALAVVASAVTISCGPRLQVARQVTTPTPSAPPGPGVARVIFIRPAKGGGGHAISVWEGNQLLAFVRGRQMTYVDLPAGHHTFLGLVANADVLEAQLAEGKTYFVHLRLVSYYWGSSVFLDPIYPGHKNWGLLESWMASARRVELIPANAAQWTQRHAAENAQRLQRYASRPEAERKYLRPENGV